MLANGIKQTTTTTGTGSLTLAAVTGYPKFSDALTTNTPFPYTLLDANGLFLEAGIGYLSDATTLVRSRVTATFNGTTYTRAGATASSLTGTTTVICAAHSAGIAETPFTIDGFNSGVGRYVASAGTTNSRATYQLGASMYYIPFQSDFSFTAVSMAINVTTAATGTAQLGIYAMGINGQPGKLLASTASFDVSTTGWKKPALQTNFDMTAGFYYVALACNPVISVTGISSSNYNTNASNTLGFAGDSFTPNLFRFGGTLMPADASAIATTGTTVDHPAILIGAA